MTHGVSAALLTDPLASMAACVLSSYFAPALTAFCTHR